MREVLEIDKTTNASVERVLRLIQPAEPVEALVGQTDTIVSDVDIDCGLACDVPLEGDVNVDLIRLGIQPVNSGISVGPRAIEPTGDELECLAGRRRLSGSSTTGWLADRPSTLIPPPSPSEVVTRSGGR